MWRAFVGLAVVHVAACDVVFGLTDRDVTELCPYAELAPDADADRDGVLNEADACPLVADHDSHDEDRDGIADACDPCPALAAAGRDLDCDQLGAACDPDDTVPHVRQYFGFGSDIGLVLRNDFSVVDDALVFQPTTANAYGRANVTTPIGPTATYELRGNVTGYDGGYSAFALEFRNLGGDLLFQVQLTFIADIGKLAIETGTAETIVMETSTDEPVLAFDLALRLDISGETLRATLSGLGTNEVTATVPMTTTMMTWGVSAYRDSGDSAFTIALREMSRVAPSP
ncbi:MAG: hypothetical protein ACKV2T_28820 [Kofleriaceae bacterium]